MKCYGLCCKHTCVELTQINWMQFWSLSIFWISSWSWPTWVLLASWWVICRSNVHQQPFSCSINRATYHGSSISSASLIFALLHPLLHSSLLTRPEMESSSLQRQLANLKKSLFDQVGFLHSVCKAVALFVAATAEQHFL